MSSERLVYARVDTTTAGPLRFECPVCGAMVGGSCMVWTRALPGDVRGSVMVTEQVLEFHQARVDLLPVGGETDGE